MRKLIPLLGFALVPPLLQAQAKPTLFVQPIQTELVVPAEWLAKFKSGLIKLLINSQVYAQVVEEKPPMNASPGPLVAEQVRANALRLKISIVSSSKGSRRSEKMKVIVLLADASSKTRLKKDFQSVASAELYGSEGDETARKLDEKIQKAVTAATTAPLTVFTPTPKTPVPPDIHPPGVIRP